MASSLSRCPWPVILLPFCLLCEIPTLAQATWQAECPQCAQHLGGSGVMGPFPTLEACNAARNQEIAWNFPFTACHQVGGAGGGPVATPNVSTGSPVGDALNLGANLWIIQNIRNPYSAVFAQNFTQGFLTELFKNDNPEAQRQRQLALAEMQRQQQAQAEQARIAEQQRLDAMFARLSGELKLSGTNTQLALKTDGPAGELHLKFGDASTAGSNGYGIQGLPGIYVGGPAPESAENNGGLKLKLGDDSSTTGTGSHGEPSMGIPGLPGLNLNNVQPEQAAQLASAATSMPGPERDTVETAALDAAKKNPALTVPTDDPFIQDYQKSAKEYDGAAVENQSALQQASEAQGHVQADQTALAYAKQQVDSSPAADQVKQAYAQMQAAAGSDEEVAVKAREMFEGTQVQLSITRGRAADALAGLATPPVNLSTAPMNSGVTTGSPASTGSAARPVSSPVAFNSLPVLSPTATPRILASPAPGGTPHVESMSECLARTFGSATGSPAPSLEDLEKKLESEKTAMERIARSLEESKDADEEFRKQMEDAFEDIRTNALDKAVEGWFGITEDGLGEDEIDLHSEIQETNEKARELRQQMSEARHAMAEAKGDPQKFAELQKQWDDLEKNQAGPLLQRRSELEDKWGEYFKAKSRMDSFTSARDFGKWITDEELPCKVTDGAINCDAFLKENNPIAKDRKGDTTASLDGIEQVVKFAAHNAEYLKYFKYVPFAVKVAENATFVGETWDALSLATDLGYDGTAILLGYQRLQQVKQNDAQFAKARSILGERIDHLNAEIGCYERTK